MIVTKENVQARLAYLEKEFVDSQKKCDEILGAVKECQSLLEFLNSPEPSSSSPAELEPEQVLAESDKE